MARGPFSSIKRMSGLRSRLATAPKLTIKHHFPWQAKAVFGAVVLGMGALVASWAYDQGRSQVGAGDEPKQQVQKLKEQVAQLSAERDQLSTTADTAQSKLDMLRATQQQLAAQVSTLEAENVRLKEDLLFFESLLPADTGAGGLGIRRLKVEQVAPGQLRYRLLVMQGGKGAAAFVGDLQFSLNGTQDGKSAALTIPGEKTPPAERGKYALNFKHYQRLEGVIAVPEGMSVKSVQARVLEKGRVRTQQSVNL